MFYSLKLDATSKFRKHFIAINIQYVKNDEIEIKNLTLIEMNDQSTGKNIARLIINVIAEYRLNFTKLIAITVDNGRNMVSSVSYLNENCYPVGSLSYEYENEEIYVPA